MQKKPVSRAPKDKALAGTAEGESTRASRQKTSLPETKQLFQSLVDNLREVIFRLDVDGTVLYVSRTVYSVTGYRPREIMGKHFSELIHPQDLPGLQNSFERTLSGIREPYEFRMLHKNGTFRYVQTSSSTLEEDGKVVGLVGVLTDLTEQKQFEESLRESEIQYRLIFENSPIGIGVADKQGRLLAFNDAILKPSGYTRKEMKKLGNVHALYHDPADREKVLAELGRTGRVTKYPLRFRRKDGSAYDALLTLTPVEFHGVSCVQAIVEDISGQKDAERSLQEVEEKYRSIVEQLPAAVYIDAVDSISTTLYISPQIEAMSKYPPEAWISDPDLWVRLLHPEDRERVLAENERTNRTGDPFQVEYRLIARDGRVIWIRDESRLLRDPNGKPLYWHGMMMDITRQRNAMEELQRAELRYQTLVESLPIVIYREDVNKPSQFTYISPQVHQLLGVTADEWLKNPEIWRDMLHPDDRNWVLAEDERTDRTGEPFHVEYRVHTRDKRLIWLRDDAVLIRDRNGVPLYWQGYLLDITQTKQVETALRDSEASYRGLFDSVSEAIYIQDMSGTFLDVNQGAVRMYGIPREHLIGRSPADVSAPGLNDLKAVQKAARLAARGEPQQFEFWGRRASGEIFPKEVRLYKGEYFGQDVIIAFAQDITERKQAEKALRESEDKFRRIVENSPMGMHLYELDPDDRLIFIGANPAADRLLGIQHETFIGQPMEVVFPPLTETEIPSRYRQVASLGIPWEAEQVEYQDQNIRGAFQVFAFQTSQNRLAVLFQDVTGRKRSELEIQRRLKEVTVLHAVAQAGTRAVIVDDLIEQVTQIIAETFKLDSFGFMLYNPEQGVLVTHPSYHGIFVDDRPLSVGLGEGVTGSAAASRQAIRVSDTRAEPRYLQLNPGMRSELCVPILVGENLVGVINAESRQPGYFSDEDERLLVTIADSMATAIEKLRLFEAEYTRRQEAEILREATTDVATSLEIQNLYEAILTSVERIVPHDSASIILIEEDGLRIVTGRNLPPGADYLGRLFPLNDIWISIIASRQALILKDAQSHPGWAEWDGSGYIHGWMGVPLLVRGEVIGSVCLDSKTPGAFTQEHAALVQTFANQAASAIENARLFAAERQQRQRQDAMIDLMRMVGSSLDLKEVITSVMQHLVNLVPSHAGTLQLLESGKLHLEASIGLTDEQIQVIKAIALEELPLNQQVLQSRQAAWVDDTDQSEKYVRIPGLDTFRSLLMVPLLHKDNIIGLVTLDSREPSRFGAPDADLALAIASNAAVAIENARLYEAERLRRQEADTLREASATVTSTLDQKNAINLILEQLAKVVSYDSASVQLLQGDQLEIVGGRGWEDMNAVLGMRFPVPGDNPNTVVIQSRQPYILNNAPAEYSPFRTGAHQHIRSWLGVPMVIRDRIIGMLAVDSMQENHFNEESARLVSAFANQAAAAIENSRLYQQALQASERRVILHQASQEIARVSQDLEKVYEAVHRAAARLMPAEAFVISMLDESRDEAVSVYLVDKGGKWPAVRSPSNAGLSGHVIKTGRSLIIADLEKHPFKRGIHFGEEDEVRSILAVPIHSGERVVGMISAQAYVPNVYSEEDQALLEMLGVNASVAIENSRLYAETQRRLKELEFVNQVSTQLRIAKKVSDMLPMLLDQALQVLEGEAGSIWLFDPGQGVLKPAVSRGWFGSVQEEPIRPGESIAGQVFTTGKPIMTRDYALDPLTRESTRPQIPAGWGGACVPIRTMQETIGVMYVSVQAPHQMQDDEVHLLGTLCEIAGNALRRADLHEQTERQVQRLASLRAIDMAISTILDLRVTLGVLLDHIIAQLKVDAVDILLLNQHTQSFNHAASSGFRTDAIRHTQIFIGDELAGEAVRTRTTRYIPDLSNAGSFTRAQVLAGEDFRTYFGVPLIAKGQVKGVLEIFHRQVLAPDNEWRGFLETLSGQAAIAIDNSVLFEELQKTNMDLSLAYDATIEGWSRALDLRDRETEGHTLRVTDKTLQLAQIMGIGTADRIHIRRGTLLHDIGKMGVPDSILNKEGPLTEEEWQIMRRHPEFAYEMLSPITYLRPALDIPYCHHERWDGSGYPRKLKGEQIPLVARIFAVVDVWDALTSDRPYRKRWTHKAAIAYIRENGGVLFDPRVVEQFLAIVSEDEE